MWMNLNRFVFAVEIAKVAAAPRLRKYQKIQSTDQSTILTNYNIYLLNLKLKV
jgi:hypothetical protein